MKNLIRSIITISIFAGTCHNVFADFSSYDLTIYSPESWPAGGCTQCDEYADTNFWYHNYWNTETDRDECDYRGCGFNNATHPGVDYRVDASNNYIYSYGFGKVVRRRTAYGQVSIQHLVNTGEYFIVNLLHSSGIDSDIAENNYIAKDQFIGIKSGIGSDGTVSFAPHLHLEVSNSTTLTTPLTENSHPGPGDLRPSDPAFVKGGLIAHYVSTNTAVRYYNPNEFAGIKREAIPFLSRSHTFPTESDYDVYGIADTTIYGSVNLTGTFQRSSIVVRDFFNRSQV
jgi:murein DD-endopeptidase MepM/ murein hydrolase activator NlpD